MEAVECAPSVQVMALKLAEFRKILLNQFWHPEVEFIENYKAPYLKEEDRPLKVAVRYHGQFLRHSCGPGQRYFWDIYGDDFLSIELAMIAVHKADAPGINCDRLRKMRQLLQDARGVLNCYAFSEETRRLINQIDEAVN